MKYGKVFAAAASELRPDCGVNRLVVEKLSVRAPYGEVKLKLMKEIAAEQGVDWDATASESELIKAPKDYLDGPNWYMGATQVYFQTSSKDPNSKENATVYNQGGCMEDDIQNIPLVLPDVAMALTGQSISQEPRAQKHVIDESLRASASFSEQKNVKFRCDDRDDARTEIGREERFKDAATAAQAAVQSAERAAAAARAAASLAKGSFARMPGEKSNRSTCEFSAGSEEDDHKKAATMQTGPTREYIKIQMDSFINHVTTAKPLFDDYPEERLGCDRTQRVPTRKQTVFKEYSSDEDQSDSTDDDQSASPPAYRAGKFDDDHIAQQSINLSHGDSRKYSPKSWQSARRRSYDECTGDETGNHHYQRQPSKPKDMPSYRSGSSQPPQRPPPDPTPGQTVEKTSPHVHPKLPDYDDLSARLEAQALKYSKCWLSGAF